MAWLIDQTKKVSINLDNCSYIYIESKTRTLKAVVKNESDINGVKIYLASFDSLDICEQVLECISFLAPLKYHIPLPLGGDAKDWIREARDLSNEISQEKQVL